MHRLTTLAILVTACGGGGSHAPDAMTGFMGPIAYDVSHYDYAIDMSSRAAVADVKFTVTTAGDCMTIPFRPDVADAISFDGMPAAGPGVDGGADTLTACEPTGHGWATGTQVTLEVKATVPAETWGASQVGYSTTNDLAGQPFTYMVSWVGGCYRHGPCDTSPSHFATYTFTVTHPSGTQVLCPGTITPGDTVTTCDFTYPGGPSYSTFAFAASPSWTMSSLGTLQDLDVTLYDYTASGIAAAFDSDALSKHIHFMEQTFGPFPYGHELRFAVGPTYWAGFEHPGNILLSETLAHSTDMNELRHTVLHETTHQWAGDATTLADTYDFVWKESMAEYLTYVTEDEQLAAGLSTQTLDNWKYDGSFSQFFPVPGEKPDLLTYYGDVYGPGPMILFHQLEVIYGRQKILDAIGSLIAQPGQRAVSVDDVQHALEQTTGVSLANYFAGWVHGSGAPAWPRAKVTSTDMGGGVYQVAVDVTTADGVPRGCNFHVRLTGANPTDQYDVAVNLGVDGGTFTPTTVTPGFVVTGSTVDPLRECLIYPSTAPKPVRRERSIEPWRVRY
jgi:aminopeptidase N